MSKIEHFLDQDPPEPARAVPQGPVFRGLQLARRTNETASGEQLVIEVLNTRTSGLAFDPARIEEGGL